MQVAHLITIPDQMRQNFFFLSRVRTDRLRPGFTSRLINFLPNVNLLPAANFRLDQLPVMNSG